MHLAGLAMQSVQSELQLAVHLPFVSQLAQPLGHT